MIYKFRDLYPDKGPREKMIEEGPEVLSNAELLACVFITGNRKQSVIELAKNVIGEYCVSSITSIRDVNKVMQDYGLGTAKAAQLVAVVELARRLFKPNGTFSPTIRTPKDVLELYKDLGIAKKEELRVIYLNSRQRMLREELISLGSENANYVTAKEILYPAVELLARGIVMVHNHPSGVVDPSSDDRLLTKKIKQACEIIGVDLVDHIIIAGGQYYSFFENKEF
jgi:DNA repair protein RadC